MWSPQPVKDILLEMPYIFYVALLPRRPGRLVRTERFPTYQAPVFIRAARFLTSACDGFASLSNVEAIYEVR